MKKTFYLIPCIITTLTIISCGGKDEQKLAEDREQAKVGKVYNPDVQGIAHENQDSQFYLSRLNSAANIANDTVGKPRQEGVETAAQKRVDSNASDNSMQQPETE